MSQNYTPFSAVYSVFLSKITDDMYDEMEFTKEQTEALLQEILMSAIPMFEFPRQDMTDYNIDTESFNITLTEEEINILATYMITYWLDQQLASIELVRMKYSGDDFKFTSQANHIAKLQTLRTEYKEQGFHLQRLYKRRRKDSDGIPRSTFGDIMAAKPAYKQWR